MQSGVSELNAVVAVSVHKNFRSAAVELGMSPSALSHSISALEKKLGVRLFNRTTRSVSLSEAGEHFLARVRPALKEISEAMESVNKFRDTPTGLLRINTSKEAAKEVLMQPVYEFLKSYPDMLVDITTEGRLVDIVAEGFDAGIRSTELVPQDMIAISCGPKTLSFAVVGTPKYFKNYKKPKSPADLLEHRCIRNRLPSGTMYKWEFEKHGKEIKIDVKGALTLDDHGLILDAVLTSVGLGYMSEWAVRDHLKSGKLIRVLEDWTPEYPGLSLYYPSHRNQTAGLKAFIDVIRKFR